MKFNYSIKNNEKKLKEREMPSYRLIFFDLSKRDSELFKKYCQNNRVEIARYLFKIAGKEFEDVKLSIQDWKTLKPNTTFGTLPILEIISDDGTKTEINQSLSIARYLAKEFNLCGKDAIEQAQCDM